MGEKVDGREEQNKAKPGSAGDDFCSMTQRRQSLKDYYSAAQGVHDKLEARIVKAFLDGMSSKHHRAALVEGLSGKRLTWDNLDEQVRKLLASMDKRRRTRRRL